LYIEVLVELKTKSIDKTFTYSVPESLRQMIAIGKRVIVPFGHQQLAGFILSITNQPDYETKEIISIIDDEAILNEELIELGKFLQQKTLCSLSSAYAIMLPNGAKAKKKNNTHKKYETYLKLNIDYLSAYNLCKNELQKKIVELFNEFDEIRKKEAEEISASAVKTLIKNEIITIFENEVYRLNIPLQELEQPKILTEDQQKVYDNIKMNQSKTYLLHGVTGSGKTEIYMQLIANTIKENKQALMLVPEISLTAQFINNFIHRFGDNVAIIHSALSDGERYDEWRKIKNKEANIIVGVRSAIFAPINDLGIIILDEEHSNSYKQDSMMPKYHTLDVAKYRSKKHNCPLVLGSATPTLETMSRAKKGVYTYLALNTRVNQRPLPTIEFIDMQSEMKKGNQFLSETLIDKMSETLNRNEQIMILLNRRGHSTFINCSSCGFTYKCPNCDITLTYHQNKKNLQCHYCGYTRFTSNKCPNCLEEALNFFGLGTEKLESLIQEKFPNARVIRMDADTTQRKNGHEKIVNSFLNHEYDILIGTQMISKGLDFPKVTLVGVINADTSLNIPNFRSGEETFSLLQQTSGRAGRDSLSGEVIIQTFNEDNAILQCVKENDYLKFYHYEMNIRKKLKYPPFYFLANIKIKSKDYDLALQEATNIKGNLVNQIGNYSIILGPTTSSMMKINNVYCLEITIKYKELSKIIAILKNIDEHYILEKKVRIELDLNC